MPVPPNDARDDELEQPADPRVLMRPPVARVGAAVRLLARLKEPFFLRHHPRDWHSEVVSGTVGGVVLDGAYWLPGLTTLPIIPGCNGIRTLKKGEADSPELAWQAAREKSEKPAQGGWIWCDPDEELPAECLPAGVVAGGYLRQLPCQDPQTGERGVRHQEVWSVPIATIPGDPQVFRFDRQKYNLWRAWLAIAGIVRPALEQVLERKRTMARDRVERTIALPLNETAMAVRMARIQRDMSPVLEAQTLRRRPAPKRTHDDRSRSRA